MNQIHCEVCGSKEIIKVDGMFVCQQCKCKYSLDEMRSIVNNVSDSSINNSKDNNSKKLTLISFIFYIVGMVVAEIETIENYSLSIYYHEETYFLTIPLTLTLILPAVFIFLNYFKKKQIVKTKIIVFTIVCNILMIIGLVVFESDPLLTSAFIVAFITLIISALLYIVGTNHN